MRRGLAIAALSLAGFAPAPPAAAQGSELRLLSYGAPDILGTQANRGASATRHALSADGRHAVFWTAANNLVADDTGEYSDVYLSDAQTGALQRISRRPDGGEPRGSSAEASISADGRWIVFTSAAPDLSPVPGYARSVYLFDRASGQTRLLTPLPPIPQPSDVPYLEAPLVAADGAYVAFFSNVALVAADTDTATDLYLWSAATQNLELASVDTTGAELPGVVDVASAAFSPEGGHLSFTMRTLSADPDEGGVFVRALQPRTTARVAGPTSILSQSSTSLSAQGRLVAFSTITALLPGDTNGVSDVYVFDRDSGVLELASVSADGQPGDEQSLDAVLSADGRHLAFRSEASNFGPAATGFAEVYRRDRVSGNVVPLSQAAGPPAAQRYFSAPALSADGSQVLFSSYSDDLVADDANQRQDVFLVGADGVPQPIGRNPAGARIAGASSRLAWSPLRGFPLGDSGMAVFASTADNLTPQRKPGLFLHDSVAGATVQTGPDALPAAPNEWLQLIAEGASEDGSVQLLRREPYDFTGGWGGPPDGPWDLWLFDAAGAHRIDTPEALGATFTLAAALSDDGLYALFISQPMPGAGGTAPPPQLLRYRHADASITRLDVNAQGAAADRPIARRLGLSRNGRYAAFVTAANNLVPDDADASPDLFLRDIQAGTLLRLRDPQTGQALVGSAASNDAIAISDSGELIAFSAVQPDGRSGLFLLDRAAGSLRRLCERATGAPRCIQPSLSADGGVLAFTAAEALSAQDGDTAYDVYSLVRGAAAPVLESVDALGGSGQGWRDMPRLSASGDTLVFRSRGGGWRTLPQTVGDTDFLLKRRAGDAIFATGFESR